MPIKRNPKREVPPPLEADPFDLGNWLGRWQSFGFVASRCSAANIECLREIRDKKLYRSGSRTWPLFCSRYLGLSRPQADRFIQYLDEFGPNYFHLTQLVPVSPQSYRLIAHAVRDQGIMLQGQLIGLTPENAGRVLRAVRELRNQAYIDARALPPAAPAWQPPSGTRADTEALHLRLANFTKRLDRLVRSLATLATLGLGPKDEEVLLQASESAIHQLAALVRSLRR